MTINPSSYQFRPNDTSRLSGTDAKAYDNAMKLKAEVESARESAPSETFTIASAQQLAEAPGVSDWATAKQTLSGITRESDGEVRRFFKHDDKAGQQFKLGGGIAGGMIGGLGGSFFALEGDLYSKSVRHEDGSSSTQSLFVDKQSGLMNYTEWEMPAYPTNPPQNAEVFTLDTSTGSMTPGGDGIIAERGTHQAG